MTRRAHIAMIGTPDPGHIIPTLDVVHELVARGHRVTSANESAVSHLVTVTGAEFVPCTRHLPETVGEWSQDPVAALDVILEGNIQALPQLRAVYDEDPADLYLYDAGSYVGRALAEAQGKPCVHLSPAIVGEQYVQGAAAGSVRLPGADEYHARFAKWLAGSGATTTDVDEFAGRPPRTVGLITKVLQPGLDRFDPDEVTIVGPCLRGREGQGSWTRPDGAEKVLLISFGSSFTQQPEFYRQCVAAFGDLPGWHVVLSIGTYVDPAELGAVPANIEVHPWVPQMAVLEQADAFVTHAGTGGCAEALYHAVPMVAVPQGADHFNNAERLAGLGVARRIGMADVTAETLREAVAAIVADPEVPGRLERLRAEVRAEAGARQAADIIEEML
ncbi:macrolide family glycosyltransferase [Streptomyces albus]|uniref:macrolide family glycosyltransferase n=1 Tax=Streptomyces sp. NRRL F-5917 TaxID=1463873 RepID=UPI00099DD3BD|nr:macrolide family glycosyltransferase [Streptomyces sp. NRRL F-5917]